MNNIKTLPIFCLMVLSLCGFIVEAQSATQNLQEENKQFIQSYFEAFSGNVKTPELCDKYMTDHILKEHIGIFEEVLPKYELFVDEMTAEDNRVVVKSHCKGIHLGAYGEIAPTHAEVEFDFVISYTIENGLISDHWILTDEMRFMKQIGAVK